MPNMLLGREIQHDYNRRFIGLKTWRKIKSNIQTQAGRSLLVLCKNLEKDIIKLLNNEAGVLKQNLFIREYISKAYSLGLKSSGLGISQAYSNITKYHLLPSIQPFDQQVLQKEIRKAQELWREVVQYYNVQNIDATINRIDRLCNILIGTYNIGRINGSARYSLVYWKAKDTHCPTCLYMELNSPWPKEIIPIVPSSDACSCGASCNCSLKIIHSNSLSYNEALAELPDKKTLQLYLSKIAKEPRNWTVDFKTKALTRIA